MERIYRKDYSPSDFLVDTIDLVFELDPAETRRQSEDAASQESGGPGERWAAPVARRRARAPHALARRRALDRRRFEADSQSLRIQESPTASSSRPRCDSPGREHEAHGTLHFERDLLHPVRSGGLSPHHLLPGPTGRDGPVHDAHRSRARELSGPALQRQPGGGAASYQTAAIGFSGKTRSQSPATCSHWSLAIWSPTRGRSRPHRAGRSRSRSGSSRTTPTSASTRWRRFRPR